VILRLRRRRKPNWLTCGGRLTQISGHPVTRQLQVKRGTGKVRKSKTNLLPTVQRNQLMFVDFGDNKHVYGRWHKVKFYA